MQDFFEISVCQDGATISFQDLHVCFPRVGARFRNISNELSNMVAIFHNLSTVIVPDCWGNLQNSTDTPEHQSAGQRTRKNAPRQFVLNSEWLITILKNFWTFERKVPLGFCAPSLWNWENMLGNPGWMLQFVARLGDRGRPWGFSLHFHQ